MAAATEFQPQDPDFAERVWGSFCRQKFMAYIGAEMTALTPGYCEIRVPYRDVLSQQHAYFHGGIMGAIADNAGGYAGYSLMAADDSILTVEYKLNFLAPGAGKALVARARVVKPGRTLTVARADVFALTGEEEKLCATAQITLMRLPGRADAPPEASSRRAPEADQD